MKPLVLSNKICLYLDEWQAIFSIDDSIKTIDSFVGRVEELAQTYQADEDKLNSFKGDMLEVFAEIFFRIFAAHPAVGVTDYKPVALEEDYGVDAIGTNVNGDQCAVQVKYRSNPVQQITYADIARTYTAGKLTHGLALDKNDTVFLLTTGGSVTSACEIVFGNKLRVINRRIISGLVDNNQTFWQEAEELILFTLDSLAA